MTAALRTSTDIYDITGGSLRLPRQGAWTAALEVSIDLDTQDLPSGECTIELDAETFSGFILDASEYGGTSTAWIVGGAGGLTRTVLGPRPYVPGPQLPTAAIVAAEAILGAGEAADDSALVAIAGLTVDRWHRAGGFPASKALERITERFDLVWRIQANGMVWIGVDAFEDATPKDTPVEDDDGISRILIAAVPAATLRPGTTVFERRIEEVIYSFGDSAIRAELRYQGSSPEGTLRQNVENALPPAVFAQAHGATVRRQNGDYTIDLDCDDDRIGPITSVPLRVGLRGARVLVQDGDRVRLFFESGDESKPFATGIDMVDALTIVPGMVPIARQGDYGAAGSITFAASSMTSTLTITYAPPAGFPPLLPQTPIVLTIPGIADGGGTISLQTVIAEGSHDNLLKGKI